MRLKLLRRHVRAWRVQLRRAVEAADARQPGILDAVGERLRLDGKLRDRVEVRVLHYGLEPVAVRVLFLETLEGLNEPLGRVRLRRRYVSKRESVRVCFAKTAKW